MTTQHRVWSLAVLYALVGCSETRVEGAGGDGAGDAASAVPPSRCGGWPTARRGSPDTYGL